MAEVTAEVTEALARAAEKLTGELVPYEHVSRRWWCDGRALSSVQSDPGWWLRALWKAGYKVSLDPVTSSVYIFERGKRSAVAGADADDAMNGLAAALTSMGGAGCEGVRGRKHYEMH